ncbi:MAG: putative 5,10-methylenetetrahydromethanopterin reductase [Friedmanniella sp.]|nr:putative 5,10-methylenetetrahydromethanopterin reductase [Friedmanniella sp.]
MTPDLGLCFVPTLPPERLREVATACDAYGLDTLWVWEDCFKESAVASAAAALAWTTDLTVGIGLMPVPLRNVALTAMELATLARLFPGRLIAGIGHGVQSWMDQVGARPASPLTLLREQAGALRRLLDGERVSVTGRYVQLDDVALDWPPTRVPPLMIGGAGPRSLALAAELGDGNLLTAAMTEAEVQRAGEIVAHTTGRTGHPMVATLLVATGPGAADRLAEEVGRWNREPGLGIGVAGDAAQVAAAVRRLAALGATSVAAQPTADEPDLVWLIRFLGQDVRPRLAG